MATIPAPRASVSTEVDPVGAASARPVELGRDARLLLSVTRLSLGSIFAWAFLDKTFGLGHETPRDGAWVRGGSPTEGFLDNAVAGPFAAAYRSIAGAGWADWLFMIGLAGIGVALLLGIGMRLAAVSGALLLVLMWTAVLPPANHVFMDDHLVDALVLGVLALTRAGDVLGLGVWWARLPLVRRFPFLRVTGPRSTPRRGGGAA